MNRFCFLLILGIILLLGCDRDSDDGSTAFIDNDLNDGSPVVGIPAPTPFVPPASPAVLTVPASDLVGTGGTVHVFTVSLLNVTGNGSLSATTMIAAASGSLTGFPVSISFSPIIEIGPGAFSSTGTFSAALFGTGTVNTQIIYTEEDRTTAGVFTFSFSGGPPPPPPPGTEICTNGVDDDGDTLVDCGDPDCTADPSCAGGGSETIEYHDDTSETGLSCGSAAGSGYLVHFGATVLTPPFDITEISYTIDSDATPPSTLPMDVVAYTVVAGAPGVEIGRVVGVATSTAGSYTVTIPAGSITITTTEFFAGLEGSASETVGIFMGRDTTLPPDGPGIGASWLFAPGCSGALPILAFPGGDLTDVAAAAGDPAFDGNWIITVTISS